MFCQTCGTPIEEGAKACTVCGTFVENTTPVETTNPEPVYSEPVDTVPATTEDPGQGKGKASKILGIIALATTVCCLGGGIASLACAIISLIVGSQAKKASAEVGLENKQAKLGTTLSTIALILCVVIYILSFIIGVAAGLSGASSSYYYY